MQSQITRLLTLGQAADILRVNEFTLNALASAGQIPHSRIPATQNSGPQLQFNTFEISDWLRQSPIPAMNDKAYIERWRKRLERQFPEQLAALREYDKQFVPPRKPKGYSLSKVKNKKMGHVYHVRYIENGKTVPTWWSTHTSDLEAAKEFAVSNRGRLLSEYRQRKAQENGEGSPGLYAVMKNFYAANSTYMKKNALRGRTLVENTRKQYENIVHSHWLPFLKKHRIKTLDEIDTPLLARYQDHCLGKGIKRQSVNLYVIAVCNIFDYLVTVGDIKTNPCNGLTSLRVKDCDREIRGCYNIKELQGVFNKRWPDELLYLLCMVIYSTGMRNSEMDRVRVKDIIKIKKCWFIDIPKSKTKSGVRVVPLHDFVYGKLKRYIDKNRKVPEDLLFCQASGKPQPRQRYTEANIALGMFTRQDRKKTLDAAAVKDRLENENIVFYSGRHFWKTMMNAHELGEVEEYFMGHKVSGDVAKRYNHRDRQGQEKIAAKAREVFRILDRQLFTGRPQNPARDPRRRHPHRTVAQDFEAQR